MKKISVLILCLFSLVLVANAQGKKGVVNAVISTPTMGCESPTVDCEPCKLRVEGELKRIDGVLKVTADFKRQQVKITFATDRTNIEYIKTAIANMGYDADDVKANPESVARLPKNCKKAIPPAPKA